MALAYWQHCSYVFCNAGFTRDDFQNPNVAELLTLNQRLSCSFFGLANVVVSTLNHVAQTSLKRFQSDNHACHTELKCLANTFGIE